MPLKPSLVSWGGKVMFYDILQIKPREVNSLNYLKLHNL